MAESAERWHATLSKWLEKRFAPSERGANRPGVPNLSRFLRDLDAIIAQAADGDVTCAASIVSYWFGCIKDGSTPDPRVMAYIDAAGARYDADAERRDIKRALLLVRRSEGNPGGVSAKRRATPGLQTEAAMMVQQRIDDLGETANDAVLKVSEELNISSRAVWSYRQRQREGK
jgi:hypothetical protein